MSTGKSGSSSENLPYEEKWLIPDEEEWNFQSLLISGVLVAKLSRIPERLQCKTGRLKSIREFREIWHM